jgi:hypothetical protein
VRDFVSIFSDPKGQQTRRLCRCLVDGVSRTPPCFADREFRLMSDMVVRRHVEKSMRHFRAADYTGMKHDLVYKGGVRVSLKIGRQFFEHRRPINNTITRPRPIMLMNTQSDNSVFSPSFDVLMVFQKSDPPKGREAAVGIISAARITSNPRWLRRTSDQWQATIPMGNWDSVFFLGDADSQQHHGLANQIWKTGFDNILDTLRKIPGKSCQPS